MTPVKSLVLGLVLLAATVVATFVASSMANQLLEIETPLGWWALLLLVWPTVLYVASSPQLDL